MDLRFCAWVTVGLVAAGCGGSSSGSAGQAGSGPKVQVSWPARTRSVGAPVAALSCVFVFQQPGSSSRYGIKGDRPSGAAPGTVSYQGTQAAPAGQYQFTGTFFSEPGETGSIVGTASATVTVQPDGTVLSTSGQPLQIGFTSAIKSVSVNPNQTVAVGKTQTLTATAFDKSGNVLIVTPGSFTFALSGSSADISLAPNGDATGVANGSALVTASVDGVTSPAELIIVGPSSPTYDSYSITASDIAYDPARNLVYAACTSQSPAYAGLVSVIDLGGNTFGPTLPTTNSPVRVAVSGDGLYLYAGGTNGTVQRVNLRTDLVDATIALPKGTVPNQMLSLPGTTESLAISLASASDGVTDEGTVILDGTSLRSGSVRIGLSLATNATGNRIYGYQLYQSSGAHYSSATIGSTGIVNPKSVVSPVQGAGNRIHWSGGRIIFDSGAVIDPDSAALIGQFPVSGASTLAVPIVGTDVVYFLSTNPYKVGRYSLSTLTQNYSVQVDGISGYPNRAIALGSNRIGFHTTQGSPSAVYAITGLP